MRHARNEIFSMLLLNTKSEYISRVDILVGDLGSTIIHPREVYIEAIKRSAAAVIFVHNHPSGDPSPSKDDVLTTTRLIEAGDILGIKVFDHIIIGDNRYYSFAEGGQLSREEKNKKHTKER